MRILLVNRFFGGSQTPTGRMLHDVAERLVGIGHDVVVLTSSADYARIREERSLIQPAKYDVRIVGQSSRIPRVINWIWFWMQAVIRVPFMRWNRCVLLTDPPFLTVAAILARFAHGESRRIYWWTMDLYPDALYAAGLLRRDSVVYRFLQGVVASSLRVLDGVIALGANQLQRLKRYRHWRDTERFCVVIPPWDGRLLPPPAPGTNPIVSRFGWENMKIALYAGNLGEGHTFREFVHAARWLHAGARSDWVFVFAVRGSGVGALVLDAANLPNVRVMDYLPEDETAALLWSANVHLISMKSGWQGVIVPSKLYGVIKTEAPVLFIGPADADIVDELQRMHRGKSMPVGSDGESIATFLDELAGPQWRGTLQGDGDGAGAVAEYISHS